MPGEALGIQADRLRTALNDQGNGAITEPSRQQLAMAIHAAEQRA